MSIFKIGNKHYTIIPFIIITSVLIFCFLLIASAAYRYHLETEERRKLQNIDIKQKARELNVSLHKKNENLEKENRDLKNENERLKVEIYQNKDYEGNISYLFAR
ncbi:hypothetical protein J8J04_02095 ['Fragaria x ananassa' phyllody phytoplasma]|uniref:Septum formation initiator n=1 Tax='Fragaria x ananassa' phyllody phytoplasma TaxID=2358428 RepID=A0ABS5K3H9_9MOLU|nr:hypothetical protein ['Fragaria x ananassa' phyllody phytoplasma]MBS2126473.1 hypothetical protein ['Fragaria x ananassa' phyllody phytoplasma]